MDILGFNPGHDGAICYISDESLIFSIEAEKAGLRRHAPLGGLPIIKSLSLLPKIPDILSVSGWDGSLNFCAPYAGIANESFTSREWSILGKNVKHFTSTHERAHLFCSYALSPLAAGTPCYGLIWEGTFGRFYKIDEKMQITLVKDVMTNPGERYVIPYAIAKGMRMVSNSDYDPSLLAGKVMALAAYGGTQAETPEETQIIDTILNAGVKNSSDLKSLSELSIQSIGEEHRVAKRIYRQLSDRIFKVFYDAASRYLTEKLPLIIGGGCGLNCEWNTRWDESGLFEQVYVPPCVNDSGVAIGTAAEAQFMLSGKSKLQWNVYCGEKFEMDVYPSDKDYLIAQYNTHDLALFLSQGFVIAWISGRSEIGPRALGGRSLLAAPFLKETQERLNRIKSRENYRPVAPICLESELPRLFSTEKPSPHMLYFQKVTSPSLKAVTHIDGSARVQSVSKTSNPLMFDLLSQFKEITGFGVLCNTSLNFPGHGFINQMSSLLNYVQNRDIQGFVVDNRIYIKNKYAKFLLELSVK